MRTELSRGTVFHLSRVRKVFNALNLFAGEVAARFEFFQYTKVCTQREREKT
jgi:hypothetical protein